jgi:ABC-type oligopeptide transport system substrate-binding subunit
MHRRLLLPGLALAVCLAGCGTREPAAEAPRGDDPATLKRGNGGDPGSLDPALAEDLHALNVLLDLYEGLLTVAADGSIVPGVAESWTVSPDGREYRFRLRADARWTNGARVVAQHFVHGFRHALQPASRAPNAFLLAPVANFQPVMEGEQPPEALGIRAEGDDQVVIELARPAAWFPTVLTMPIALPRLPGIHHDPARFSVPARFVGAWRSGRPAARSAWAAMRPFTRRSPWLSGRWSSSPRPILRRNSGFIARACWT